MQFEITFDYLCPFARNANEAVLAGLAEDMDWQVRFRPFSLSQAHVKEDEPDVFDDPTCSGILALHWGTAIRDHDPEHFPAAHVALFAARHDEGLDIKDEAVIIAALEGTGVDVDDIGGIVASGTPARTLEKEHRQAVDEWGVFGVPTFITDDGTATFVRFMDRGLVADVDRMLEFIDWRSLNEFKRTRIPR